MSPSGLQIGVFYPIFVFVAINVQGVPLFGSIFSIYNGSTSIPSSVTLPGIISSGIGASLKADWEKKESLPFEFVKSPPATSQMLERSSKINNEIVLIDLRHPPPLAFLCTHQYTVQLGAKLPCAGVPLVSN